MQWQADAVAEPEPEPPIVSTTMQMDEQILVIDCFLTALCSDSLAICYSYNVEISTFHPLRPSMRKGSLAAIHVHRTGILLQIAFEMAAMVQANLVDRAEEYTPLSLTQKSLQWIRYIRPVW